MAEEIKKEAHAAAKTDTDVTKVKLLEDQVASLLKDNRHLEGQVKKLEERLKAAKSQAPAGDVVFLDGKTWPAKGTVRAKNALEEVKRGHIPEDASLVIIDRTE